MLFMRKQGVGKWHFVFLFLFLGCATKPTKMPWPAAQGGALDARAPFKETKTLIQDVWPPADLGQEASGERFWDTASETKYLLLQWPIAASSISSLYGHRIDPLDGHKRFHHGLDLVAAKGTPIGASASGKVVRVSTHGGHGKRVVIKHLDNYFSSYSHLSEITVEEGQWVEMGHRIGRVGTSGRSTGPHLHLEIYQESNILNPLNVLGHPIKMSVGP